MERLASKTYYEKIINTMYPQRIPIGGFQDAKPHMDKNEIQTLKKKIKNLRQ